MSAPTTLAAVDLSADCHTHGHVFGTIDGSVRHCQRHGCSSRDAYDPDVFLTADGDIYCWEWDDRDELGYADEDAYVLKVAT